MQIFLKELYSITFKHIIFYPGENYNFSLQKALVRYKLVYYEIGIFYLFNINPTLVH